MIRMGCGFGEEYHRDEVLFSSHRIRGHDMTDDASLHQLGKVVCARFLCCEDTIFYFHMLSFGSESLSPPYPPVNGWENLSSTS